jgi:5-methyltetrahydrofolate--homocysteine methyltransferase
MEVLAGMKKNWPDLQSTCGLSNISFGLPNRKLLNRVYLAMLIAHGLAAAIVDPLDSALMAQVFAARALHGRDEYCMDYIRAHRAKRLEV